MLRCFYYSCDFVLHSLDGNEEGRRRGGEAGKGDQGRVELAGCSSQENLHAMVAGVGHDDAPFAVDGDAAVGAAELPVA